jgi:hypothetical protein
MLDSRPKCLRCGRTIPPRRRATSDYCSVTCAIQQEREDAVSQASERAAQDEIASVRCTTDDDFRDRE